ncbi:MAG: hypothetical protein GY878_22890 [Fuerstiella sp.]|nr:hypothetical protein [Fuerstiella sp.]
MRLPCVVCCLLPCSFLTVHGLAFAQPKEIPQALEPWKNWVLWGESHSNCPTPFNAADQPICFWPSRLTLSADQEEGSWKIQVRTFEDTWVPLPGDAQSWPFNVRSTDELLPVVQRDGIPSVRLPAGVHNLSGEFRWSDMPQRVAVPKAIGILTLVVNGETVPIPNWDAAGDVWLKRSRSEEAERDLLTTQVYRIIEDGIPLWLRTEIDLTVSGKSREEQLGWILPYGWQLSLIDSSVPVAVDDQGRMKAQVRAGNWKIQVHAFRNSDLDELRFAPDAAPVADVELVGFRARPDLRVAEIEGVQAVDVKQTSFPEKWRDLPVFEWQTDSTFRLVEKMRGMGMQRPKGITVARHLWLDEDGRGITFRDRVSGELQQLWRLDVAEGQQLGTVRVDGEPQLITANPQTGTQGVEIRNRNLQMETIGRTDLAKTLSATGWQTDVESLHLSFSLPPGWRVFCLFGADNVEGDWLTAWSLLDLFLLLIFSLAVFRLWGFKAGIVALLAFGLSYHESGAPRLTWFFLLMPVALLRVVGEGRGKGWLNAWKFLAMTLLVLSFVPFVARQVQGTIYPQLETVGVPYRARSMFEWLGGAYESGTRFAHYVQEDASVSEPASSRLSTAPEQGNLLFDPRTKIQTGPAEPEWEWNQVHCYWNGPVSSDQQITPVLISRPLQQGLTVVRLLLLFLLAAIVFGVKTIRLPRWGRRVASAALLVPMLFANTASAQIPDRDMLETLRERLLEPSDAYPHAAEIASVALTLNENRLTMRAEVHAAIEVAVPLPGRLPSWSPLSVTVDDQPDAPVCRRDDGYLWVTVPAGVHEITIAGLLADAAEWEWAFLLPPRRVSIDAPGWNITGVRPHGVPENQVLLARQEQTTEGEATYDQKHFHAIVAVDRSLEAGLVWKVHNTVSRQSEPGKAVSIRVPLLPGERVLTSNAVVEDGTIQVNLGASQRNFRWESELEAVDEIRFDALQTEQWIERWHLITSAVWNVSFEGLAPIYESSEERLIPVWHPWPGEGVTLAFRRPKAISGETVTVQRVLHETTLRARQRETSLRLQVESSLGADFRIGFDSQADVSSVSVASQSVPVRRDGEQLIVPLRPGKQSVEVSWTSQEELLTTARVGAVNLPAVGANVTTTMMVPQNRWILWANGPQRGPAVRFWTIVASAILVALVLGSVSLSPLRRIEWVLLALGLTQVHISAAMLVVGWLFLLAWRSKREPGQMGFWRFNLLQLLLVFLTFIVMGIFIVVVGEGLLGNPDMFIVGNGSSRTSLNWFQPRIGLDMPEPHIISISVWYYRLLMLFWALWLATALLRWLHNGWNAFSNGGCWKPRARKQPPVVARSVES